MITYVTQTLNGLGTYSTVFPKKINFATAFKTRSSSHHSTCTDSGVRRDCGTVPHSQSAFGDVSTKVCG